MSSRALLLVAALACLPPVVLGACSQPARSPKGGRAASPEADAALLTLPPQAGTPAALEVLRRDADGGDAKAAWAWVHYTLDLFDYARFVGGEPGASARRVLAAATGVPEGHGPLTTDRVIDAILVVVDRLMAIDRLHPEAQQTRTLLEFERTLPADRAEVFRRTSQLKPIARADGPLSANATLRLATFCRRAFRDAAEAPTSQRPLMLDYCLYPLYDADPEAYFAKDPSRRPPPPSWEVLASDVRGLEERIATHKSRIVPVGAALVAEDTKFLDAARTSLPTPLDPRAVGVPMVLRAEAYDFTPLVQLGDGTQMAPPNVLAKKIEPALRADGRGRVALALGPTASRDALFGAATAAIQAGAERLELVVGYTQRFEAPVGDYWHGRLNKDAIERLGVVTLALAPLGVATAGAPARDVPRASGWDPARASLGLHLLIGPERWQLVSPGGHFPALPAREATAAVAPLREQLAAIRRAYPDEDALVIVPEAGVTVRTFAQAAEAARTDETGEPLFAALGLGREAPAPAAKGKAGDLAARVTRRAAARVVVEPANLANRAEVARRCYLDALERSPRLEGTYVLELTGEDLRVTSGPADPKLRACLLERLGAPIRTEKARSVRLRLTLAPEGRTP